MNFLSLGTITLHIIFGIVFVGLYIIQLIMILMEIICINIPNVANIRKGYDSDTVD